MFADLGKAYHCVQVDNLSMMEICKLYNSKIPSWMYDCDIKAGKLLKTEVIGSWQASSLFSAFLILKIDETLILEIKKFQKMETMINQKSINSPIFDDVLMIQSKDYTLSLCMVIEIPE